MTSPEHSSPRPKNLPPGPRWAGLLLSLGAVVAIAPALAAQDPAPKAEKTEKVDKTAGLFDDEPAEKGKETAKPEAKKAESAKPEAKKAEPAKAEVKKVDTTKPGPTAAQARDNIGFTQDNATSQMTELEERMYRLSEALRSLEPENASRLRLALKFSREELILEQMRETHRMLKDAQLSRAETEVRELLAKLEHLRNVLLAEDLDFQLKLARLRQIRETLNQLDRIVKEERRELGWSRFAIDQKQARERLAARRPDLEALARDQGAVVADLKANASADKDAAARQQARASIRDREAAITRSAAALAANPLFADFQPSKLRAAETQLNEASTKLGEEDGLASAAEPAARAEAVFRDEITSLDGRVADAAKDVSEGEFGRHEDDQSRNRQATESLAAASTRLGDTGIALQKDLIRAGGAMRTAESELKKTAADPAATEQTRALDILVDSRESLAKAAEKLMVQLRSELQARLVAELTEMHEAQAAIRETTEAQVPRLAQKSRSATIAVAGLSPKEADLATRCEGFLALVEEVEFGIALPTTLRVLGREMREIEGKLKEADASPPVIALEKRVEDDLLALIQAVRRLPPTTPPKPGEPLPSNPRERERELNRLVSELKMIRLLQVRLNDDTTGVDKTRPNPSDLPPALRRELEALESTQEEIRDSMGKIAERIEDQ